MASAKSLDLGRAFGRGLQRAAALRGPDAVHEMRVAVKELRAMNRLCKKSRQRRSINAELRRVGRGLRAQRESEVLWRKLNEVQAQAPGEARAVERARESLRKKKGRLQRQRAQALALAARRLRSLGRELRGRGLEPDKSERALARSYRKARRLYRECESVRSPQLLHELRRRIKDLQYQLKLLGRQRPALRKTLSRIQELGRTTGDYRDSLQLEQWLIGAKAAPLRLLRRLDKERRQRHAEALREARALLAPKSKVWLRRLSLKSAVHRR